jgi:peptidoglycan/LPS O-acetylase OafA/YrhL
MLPGVTDFLCAGAGVAYLERERPDYFTLLKPVLISNLLLLAALLLIVLSHLHGYGSDFMSRGWSLILAMRLVMEGIDAKEKGFFRSTLSSAPFVHIGKISYGIYVYHPFMIALFGDFLHIDFTMGLRQGQGGHAVTALAYLSASLIAAEMSWVLLEKPISRFKANVPSSWFTEVAST